MKKIAVILSGCGVYDGSEVYESVLTLLHIAKIGASSHGFAPNKMMHHVVDHANQKVVSNERRDIMTESARINRGPVMDLANFNADNFDALIIPGGFGVVKNLCTFLEDGVNMTIDKDLYKAVNAMREAGKPCGFICIAPVMIPNLFGSGTKCTVGNDPDVISEIEKMGGVHINCAVDDIVIDKDKKVISTPGFMLASSIDELEVGIEKMVAAIIL